MADDDDCGWLEALCECCLAICAITADSECECDDDCCLCCCGCCSDPPKSNPPQAPPVILTQPRPEEQSFLPSRDFTPPGGYQPSNDLQSPSEFQPLNSFQQPNGSPPPIGFQLPNGTQPPTGLQDYVGQPTINMPSPQASTVVHPSVHVTHHNS